MTNQKAIPDKDGGPQTTDNGQPLNGGQFLEYVEQYRCPRCDSAINHAHVQGNTTRKSSDGRLRRLIRVYCDHCDELFSAVFLVIDGRLAIESGPAVVSETKASADFKRRLAALRGDVQVA